MVPLLRIFEAERPCGVHYGRNGRSVKATPVKTFMNSGNSTKRIIDASILITQVLGFELALYVEPATDGRAALAGSP